MVLNPPQNLHMGGKWLLLSGCSAAALRGVHLTFHEMSIVQQPYGALLLLGI